MTYRFPVRKRVAKIIESSAVGSETVREKSGWQGKLSTKGHIACSTGVFFERATCSRKRLVETPRREEEMGRVKGSGEGAGREKRKRLPENTVKMRNTP